MAPLAEEFTGYIPPVGLDICCLASGVLTDFDSLVRVDNVKGKGIGRESLSDLTGFETSCFALAFLIDAAVQG